MTLWQGSCIVHETFSERKLVGLFERHPGAEVIAHPECEDPILRHAQFIGSTTALLKYAVIITRADAHRRDRIGHPASDDKGGPAQRLHPAPSRGQLRLQRVPLHARKFAREGVSRATRFGAAHRDADRAARARPSCPSIGCSRSATEGRFRVKARCPPFPRLGAASSPRADSRPGASSGQAPEPKSCCSLGSAATSQQCQSESHSRASTLRESRMAPQLRKAQPQSSEQLVRGTMPCVRSGPKRLEPDHLGAVFLELGE